MIFLKFLAKNSNIILFNLFYNYKSYKNCTKFAVIKYKYNNNYNFLKKLPIKKLNSFLLFLKFFIKNNLYLLIYLNIFKFSLKKFFLKSFYKNKFNLIFSYSNKFYFKSSKLNSSVIRNFKFKKFNFYIKSYSDNINKYNNNNIFNNFFLNKKSYYRFNNIIINAYTSFFDLSNSSEEFSIIKLNLLSDLLSSNFSVSENFSYNNKCNTINILNKNYFKYHLNNKKIKPFFKFFKKDKLLNHNLFFIFKFFKNKIYNNNLNVVKHNNFLNINNFLKYFILQNDLKLFYNNTKIFSNYYIANFFSMLSYDLDLHDKLINEKNDRFYHYNNYYPAIELKKKSYDFFFNSFKQTYSMNHTNILNKVFISFFEAFLKKKIYLKIDNNFFNKIKNPLFHSFLNNHKNNQPLYFKNFLLSDFLEILWYSFLLRDLSILSEWISIFMETLNFKNHKKFVIFFQNLMTKNYNLFFDILGIKGFLFDIRGKVGVTGSSKKRHLCFKFGSLKKSSKKYKLNFNQGLVRTYSGVMGLTYIMSF